MWVLIQTRKIMIIQKSLAMLVCVFSGICAGCTQQPVGNSSAAKPIARSTKQTAVQSTATSEPSAETSTSQKSIELTECDWNQLQSLVAEKKGKVVVVDVWSTACEP